MASGRVHTRIPSARAPQMGGQCELGHEYHFVAKTYFSNVSLRVPTNDPASSLYR
jgi:hypothetical protein